MLSNNVVPITFCCHYLLVFENLLIVTFQVLLRKPYTSAVDDWAIGVIAYILLSGMMPFDDENKTRLYRTIINGDYNFNGDVSEIKFSLQKLEHCSFS